MTLVLNAPVVLEHNAVNRVLNIGAEPSLNYSTPSSVYLQRVLRPFVSDLIPADETFERSFDTFEVLLAMRYIVDGGRGLPTGQYGYRRYQSFSGRSVPEQLHAEMQRESTGWPPLVSGLFDGTEQAELAMSGLIEGLAKLDWG